MKLKIKGSTFIGDANNCFDATTDKKNNMLLARHYWDNLPNPQGESPIREILVSGDIEVVDILEIIHKNLIFS